MSKMLKLIVIALFLLLASSTIINEWKPDWTLQQILTGPVFWRLAVLLVLLAAVFSGWGFLRKIEASQKYTRADQVLEKARQEAKKEKERALRLEKEIENKYREKLKAEQKGFEKEKLRYRQRIKKLEMRNLELQESISGLMKMVKKNKNDKVGDI